MDFLQKIITAEQTRKADAHTIASEPIASIDLMERASQAFVKSAESHLPKKSKIAVVCGPGNNGGDGLAITRLLLDRGYQAEAYLLRYKKDLSKDCEINKNRLDSLQIIDKNGDVPDWSTYDVLIDAIFGSGLTRPISSPYDEIVESVNNSDCKVIAVDIASGMFCDSINKTGPIIRADVAISFQRPKRSFFFPEHGDHIDRFDIVDIGLNEEYTQSLSSCTFIIDHNITRLLRKRKRYSHKGSYGHALMMVGSKGMIGAAVLSSESCLRSGAGLVTAYTPSVGQNIMQSALPAVMCKADPNSDYLTTLPDLSAYDVIGIGPGIGQHEETRAMFEELLECDSIPFVIDADGLNMISSKKELFSKLPPGTILTPHIKEFDRLVGESTDSFERYQKQLDFSKQHNCIVILKDAQTCVTSPDGNQYYSSMGNSGMATGGSGDVLTGIITGLRAQGYNSLSASLLGVYYHGLAGNNACEKKGENSMIATDIVDSLRIMP